MQNCSHSVYRVTDIQSLHVPAFLNEFRPFRSCDHIPVPIKTLTFALVSLFVGPLLLTGQAHLFLFFFISEQSSSIEPVINQFKCHYAPNEPFLESR